MSDTRSLEGDVAFLRRLQGDAFEAMGAVEETLLLHSKPDARLTAINFPQEESLLRDAIDLLAKWKAKAAELLRQLDAATAVANLQFEQLFDQSAGRSSAGFWRRRVPQRKVPPETIAAGLGSLLSVSAAVERMLRDAKPVLAGHHRACEACVQQLITRRQLVDLDLDEASRRIASLKEQEHGRQLIAFGRHSPVRSAYGAERRTLPPNRRAAKVRGQMLQSEQETLRRMIADDEDCVEALNAGIAAINAMSPKLSVDMEQRVALLKAVKHQSSGTAADLPASVQALIDAFDANIFSGHDILARKKAADDMFDRRLSPPAASGPSDMEAGAPESIEKTSPSI